jgi:hypothetical protein
LRILFYKLFPATASPYIKVACRLGYPIIGSGDQATMVYLPILLHPKFQFTASQIDWNEPCDCSDVAPNATFVRKLACTIESRTPPSAASVTGSSYAFEVDIYSSVNSDDNQPLLQITNLQLDLKDITQD